jgi:hypothetical protein
MKKPLIISLLFLLSQIVYCQSNKEIIYIDTNKQRLTLEEFEFIDKSNIVTIDEENDSVVLRKIYVRDHFYLRKHGHLDSLQHVQINNFLHKIIDSDYDEDKKTLIHLYSLNNENLERDIKYKRYWKAIKKRSHKYQTFLIGTKDSGVELNRKKKVYKDSYDLLKNLFFSDSKFQINHLFIKPNGDIIVYYGGEEILFILDESS